MAAGTQGRLRRVLRSLGIGVLAATVSFAVLAVVAVAFVRQAASRIVVEPEALGEAMREAVLATMRDGTTRQKLDLIASLETAVDASPFAPLLAEAAGDRDPEVREAAAAALRRIAPRGANPD